MNKNIKLLLIIQLQVLVVLVIVLLFKVNKLDDKVHNTNKFVYNLLTEQKKLEQNKIVENDLVIGDEKAPKTIIMYTRFDCSVCMNFFTDVYPEIYTQFIEKGELRFVVRNLVHPSKKETLYFSKCALLAHYNGFFNEYMEGVAQIGSSLDTLAVEQIMLENLECEDDLYAFINDKGREQQMFDIAQEHRSSGISATPTFFMGTKKVVGHRKFGFFKKEIAQFPTLK